MPYADKNGKWNGGMCMRHGYIYLLKPDHINCNAEGYVAKHRLVFEKHIGRILSRGEIVHHVDNNKLNNKISNLMLVTKKQHMDLHRESITKELKKTFKRTQVHSIKCASCGEIFETWKSNKYSFCSRKCYWKSMIGKPGNKKGWRKNVKKNS